MEYKMCYDPEHPNAASNGLIREHTIIAAKALGSPLPKGSEVHHHTKDQLVLCENHNYHHLIHVRQRAYEATGDPHKRKCPFCKDWDDPSVMNPFWGTDTGFYHLSCRQEYRREQWRINRI